jgi:DNA repair protein RadC
MNTSEINSPNKNIHEGHRERMRNRFRDKGLSRLEDHEILELILYYVYARKDTNGIGHNLLKEFGTLEKVFSANEEELLEVEGIGETKGAKLPSRSSNPYCRCYHHQDTRCHIQDPPWQYSGG